MTDPGVHETEYERNTCRTYGSDHHPPVIVHLPADIAVLIALLYHDFSFIKKIGRAVFPGHTPGERNKPIIQTSLVEVN